ncbi:F-box protein [Musa troglodytarum]|uniref:F-box protein n=1 Tax=Musa troglodytarum TaxID=320322 RepID=A0A9E7IAA4_9LILI|nr:F-box protein [Musa troglodytarum]URE45469.1 F-box protein [Musa troglodytarum]
MAPRRNRRSSQSRRRAVSERAINCELLLREPYFIRRNHVPGPEIDRWIRILFLRLVPEITWRFGFYSSGFGSLRKWFSGRRLDFGEASEVAVLGDFEIIETVGLGPFGFLAVLFFPFSWWGEKSPPCFRLQ